MKKRKGMIEVRKTVTKSSQEDAHSRDVCTSRIEWLHWPTVRPMTMFPDTYGGQLDFLRFNNVPIKAS